MLLQRLLLLILLPAALLFSACTMEKEPESTENMEFPDNKIEVREAWARPAKSGMMGGGYMTILNGKEAADTLIGISTPIAKAAEVHESYEEDGLSGMRPAGKLPIEARSKLEMKPGGYHLMLMQLNRDLAAGDSIAIGLIFSSGDSISLHVPVTPLTN